MLVIIRSLLFNIVFYLSIIIQMLIYTPFFFFLPHKKAWAIPKFWGRSNLWLQKHIAGTDLILEGLENLPDGAYIVAAKHQSFWDVFAFLSHLDDPVFILKRELMRIPFFGWYLAKMKMIPVDRGSGLKAVNSMLAGAQIAIKEGRQIVIFPEGTRREPGAEPHYKYGIVRLYTELNIPVIPIAHNAGLYWPRHKFLRYPGAIRARILPPIEPGLDKDVFLARLIEETETACDELLLLASQDHNPPPMPPSAQKKLAKMKAAN